MHGTQTQRLTSQTHPLQIAGIKMLGPWGLIGITFCPGKKDAASRPGIWERDLDTDLDAIKAWGTKSVVTLIEPHEFKLLQVEGLGSGVRARGMSWYHLPIRDVSIPDIQFEQRWPKVSRELLQTLKAGDNVVIHCRGGLGRAGLVTARLLIETGLPPDKVIRGVRAVRPGAIETREQENYLRNLEVPPLCR